MLPECQRKQSILFVKKKLNFSKNKMQSKIGNSENAFREVINLVLQLIYKSQIKCKSVMSWGLQEKKSVDFTKFILSPWSFFIIYL